MRFLSAASLFCAVFCSTCPNLPAQTVELPSVLTDEQIVKGLMNLAVMLDPDLPTDARWVRIQSQGREIGLLSYQGDGADIKGNGFIVREKAGIEAEIWMPVIGGVTLVRAAAAAKPEDEDADESPGTVGPSVIGEWKSADLSHDVDEVTALLRKHLDRAKSAAATKAVADDFEQGYGRPSDPRSLLRLSRQSALLWAGGLQRTGHAAEALKIGSLALQGTSEADRKSLLDTAFNFIASARWQRSLNAFANHRDWKKLRDDLKETVQRFATGWGQRDAARVLLRKLDERAALTDEPPLKLSKPLTSTEQQVLLDWLKPSPERDMRMYEPWSLLPSLVPDENSAPVPVRTELPSFPASKGMAAIPMLAALLADDTLIAGSWGRGNQSYPSFYRNRDGDPLDQLKHDYQQFAKPPTRSECAWARLEQVLPGEMRQNNDESPADRASAIMQWYATIKDASPADLALSYLENGDHTPNVIAHAVKTTDEKKLARVEDALIANAQIYDLDPIEPFVRERGEKAAGFLKKLRTKLEGDLDRFERNDDTQKKQLDRAMKRLEARAGGKVKQRSADELFAAIAKLSYGEESELSIDGAQTDDQADATEAWKDLPAVLSKLPDAERLKLVLKHLPEFHSSQVVSQLLPVLLDAAYARQMGQDMTIKLKPEERKQALSDTRARWLLLLDAKFPDLRDDEQRLQFTWGIAFAVESLATGKPYVEIGQNVQSLASLGLRVQEIIRARAMAFLDGKEPSPLPDAKTVPAEESKKLFSDLGALPPGDLRKRLDTLPPSQFLAIYATLSAGEKWPDGFTKLATQVQRVKFTGMKEESGWQSWAGHTIDFDALVALARQATALDTANAITASVTFSSPLDGWTLEVSASEKKKRDYFGEELLRVARGLAEDDMDTLAKHCRRGCFGWFGSGRTQVQWGWLDAPTVPASGAAKPSTPATKLPEVLEQFTVNEAASWDQVRSFFTDLKKPLVVPTSFHVYSASSKTVDEAAKVKPD